MRASRLAPGLLLFTGALALRALYLEELSHSILLRVLVGDGFGYDHWARALIGRDGHAPDVFYQAPLYPYALAAVYRVTGPSLPVVYGLQACLGAAACVLLAQAGRRFVGPRAGLLAGAGLAVYPYAIFYVGLVQKTTPALFFLCLLLWLVARARDAAGPAWPFATGLALGGLALLRENALALLPILALFAATEPRGAPRRARAWRTAAVCAGTVLVLLPVAWRNASHGGGGLLPTTFQLGTNLYAGNYHGASGRYVPPREGGGYPGREQSDASQLAEAALGRSLTPAEVSNYWVEKTLAEIRAAPLSWLGLMLRKSLLLVNAEEVLDTEAPEVYADQSLVLRGTSALWHFGVLFPVALWGLVASAGRRRRLWILHALLLFTAASVVAFFVLGRLRMQLVPILLLFAGAGIDALPGLRAAGARRIALCAGCGIAGALVANHPLPGAVAHPRAFTYNEIGVALRREGRTALALTWFDRALEHDPNGYRALLNKAELLRTQGHAQEAVALARRAVLLEPRSAVSRQFLAAALKDAGRTEEALAEIREALELDPGRAASHSLLGLLLLQQGRPDEAIRELSRYVAMRPDDPRGHNNLGVALARSGRLAEAEAAYREALRLDPHQAGARRNLEALRGR